MGETFSKFSDPIRSNDRLREVATFKTFPPKTTILNEDDHGGSVYFILEGQVNITGYSARGREVWYSRLGAGQSFGEMAALTDGLRTASVVTAKETTTAIISKADFIKLLADYPQVSLWLMRELVKRLEDTTTQLYERVALNMPTRVCTQILDRCAEDANADGEYVVKPDLILAQMARRLNTDRENISRVISELIKEGLLRKEGRTLFVLSKDGLEAKLSV